MALGTLLALVTFGIALVMLVTHALGGSTTRPLAPHEALAAFVAEHPTLPVRAVRHDAASASWGASGRVVEPPSACVTSITSAMPKVTNA
ncbi:MAG: hypothetical protein AAF602_17265, partial [Myxococcota bacterium]